MAIFPHIYLRVICVNNYRFKIVLCLLGVTVFTVVFFVDPEGMIGGVSNGLSICAAAIIPSLFPFMVISDFVIRSGVADMAGKFINPITKLIFRLPGSAGCAIIMSMLGGYPVGAKMTAQLLEDGSINRNQAKRMLLFCVNAGPAFVIGTVGTVIFSSRRAGVILYLSMIVSSLIMGLASGIFSENEKDIKIKTPEFRSGVFSQSVMQGVNSTLMLCAWVLLFSCVGSYVNKLPVSISMYVSLISEVTGACISACGRYPVSIQALIMGWAGVCVHCQLLPFIKEIQLKYRHFAVSRIVHGALAATVADVLFRFFPCETDVFSTGTEVLPEIYSVSVPAAVSTVILSAMLIAELTALIKKKNNA